MALVVQKFGGTSVGSPERILKIADKITESHRKGDQLVIVVSAMGHTTDELISLAYQVAKSPSHREMDMLLTVGERISMSLLSMALGERGVSAVSLTGSQTGIVTDSSHRRARIKRILGDRVRSALSEGKVAIVAGFQGVSETKEITTLGRGGSDTTAVALAAALKAASCEIYTDVDGVFSADPRVVKEARLWSSIPSYLMVELATLGAGVLHPRSVELAKRFGVPLWVKNSFSQNAGTLISPEKDYKPMENFAVVGVTADKKKFLVTLELARPSVLASLWGMATQSHLSVVAPQFSENQVSFFADTEMQGDWSKLLDDWVKNGFLTRYELAREWVPLSIVGERFSQDSMALEKIFDVLSKNHIVAKMGASSSVSLTTAVLETHVDDAVRALHKEFLGGNKA